MAIGVGALLLSFGLQAQEAGDGAAAAQQLQRIQQEQQLLQQKQFEEDRASKKSPVKLDMPVQQRPQLEPGGICRDIKDIQVRGVTLVKAEELQPVLVPYINRCLTISDIESVMADVSAVYFLKGYIAARVYLAEQDLNNGVLVLLVLEGELQELKINDDDESISLFNTFPGKVGEPLNLRDVEQALEQLNRLQSNNVTMKVLPGKLSGASVLAFDNKKSKRWQVTPSFDNQGSKTTGTDQIGVSASLDNVFGLNDFLVATYRQTRDYDAQERGSKLKSFTYVVPFGYTTVALNGSESEYASPLVVPSGNVLKSSGNSENLSVRVDRTVYRDRDSRWNIAMVLGGKESENYLDDVLLTTNSRRLTIVDIDSTYSLPLLGGVARFTVGFAHGINGFGALDDASDLPKFAPKAQFGKWKYGASYQRSFRLADQPLVFSSQLTGQYAQDVLYGSEQLLIGGIYTVRGFSKNSLSGDHGYYVRNDIAAPMPLPLLFNIPVSIRPYIGIDYGRVSSINANVPEGSLSGFTLGTSFTAGSFYFDIANSRAINKSSSMKNEGDLTFFRMSMSF